jgi:hypothetical protein
MAEVDKGKIVSLQELMVSTLAGDRCIGKATNRERRHHGRGVQAETT